MRRSGIQTWAIRALTVAIVSAATAAASRAEQPTLVADPGTLDAGAQAPLCCGVPRRDEVKADHVFGRWVVMHAPIGMPMSAGEKVEFRRDGTLATARGPCRFAVLRTELTVSCAEKAESGEVRFQDDTKLIWRHDGREMIFVAPTD
jgi:hypothetical protein